MNNVKGIELKRGAEGESPWVVHIAENVFGKRQRQWFKTKELAMARIAVLENKVLNKNRVPLDPEIHKVISNYQNIFSADELRVVLEKAVAAKELGNGTIGDFGDAYLAFKEDALELGPVSRFKTP